MADSALPETGETDRRLAEIEARLGAATPGPWRVVDLRHQKGGQIRIFSDAPDCYGILANVLASGDRPGRDAAFIAAAPADLRFVLAELRAARASRPPMTPGLRAATLTPDEIERALIAQGVPREKARLQAHGYLADRHFNAKSAGFVRTLGPELRFPVLVTLPWSSLISDNAKYAPTMRGSRPAIILKADYRQAKANAVNNAKRAMIVGDTTFPPLEQPLRLVARVWLPDNRPGHDVVNFAKCAQDAMQGVVYKNDAQLHDARWIRMGVDVDRPRAEITIEPLATVER